MRHRRGWSTACGRSRSRCCAWARASWPAQPSAQPPKSTVASSSAELGPCVRVSEIIAGHLQRQIWLLACLLQTSHLASRMDKNVAGVWCACLHGRLCKHKGALAATANALLLHKCLQQRLWDTTALEVRQLPRIGKLLGERLAAAGLGKLRALAAADPRRIEAVTQRHYPFGAPVAHSCLSEAAPVHLSSVSSTSWLQVLACWTAKERDTCLRRPCNFAAVHLSTVHGNN